MEWSIINFQIHGSMHSDCKSGDKYLEIANLEEQEFGLQIRIQYPDIANVEERERRKTILLFKTNKKEGIFAPSFLVAFRKYGLKMLASDHIYRI